MLAAYEEGKRLIEERQTDPGLAHWVNAAETAQESSLACWLWLRAGEVSNDAGDWHQALPFLQRAVDRARASRDPVVMSQSLQALGEGLRAHAMLSEADRALNEALGLRMQMGDASLLVAETLRRLAELHRDRGDLPQSQELLHKALVIEEGMAPESDALASTLVALAIVDAARADVESAQPHAERALAIEDALHAESQTLAHAWTTLGGLAWARGDLEQAHRLWTRALALDQKLHPAGQEAARDLTNLAIVATARGNLASSDDFLDRARAILDRLSPGSLSQMTVMSNLAGNALDRGDLEEADRWLTQALAIDKRYVESWAGVAVLAARGDIAVAHKDWPTARTFYSHALEIAAKLAPGYESADLLLLVAHAAQAEGRLNDAKDLAARALDSLTRTAPDSGRVALGLKQTADLAAASGELDRAVEAYAKAIEIEQRVLPGSRSLAEAYHGLALVQWRRGDLQPAVWSLSNAMQALEAQIGRLGGPDDVKAAFGADQIKIYRDAIDLLVETGDFDAAFQVLERSRARLLLAMLAERDLVFSSDIPAELDHERRRIDVDYDRLQTQLLDLSPGRDNEKMTPLLDRVRDLRDRRSVLTERIRSASPHLASLRYPQPLDRKRVQEVLDPGTVLLSYSVHADGAFLFVLRSQADSGGDPVSVFRIGEGREALGVRVQRFRHLVDEPDADNGPLSAEARDLYRLLIQPAERSLRSAARVLVCPDGPLELLPWAALMRGRQYLGLVTK